MLDFFAGSGTLAHAVFEQNAADGGSRNFILAQVAEPIDESSEAGRAQFGNIAELARERIRRAGARVGERAGLAGRSIDTGFRSLRVDTTNLSDVLRTPDAVGQDELELFADSVKPDRTGDDLLFQVLLDWGLELAMPVAVEQIEGHEVFVVEGGALIACFSGEISSALVRVIAGRRPLRGGRGRRRGVVLQGVHAGGAARAESAVARGRGAAPAELVAVGTGLGFAAGRHMAGGDRSLGVLLR